MCNFKCILCMQTDMVVTDFTEKTRSKFHFYVCLVFKSTDYFSIGSGYCCQYSYGGSQTSAAQVPRLASTIFWPVQVLHGHDILSYMQKYKNANKQIFNRKIRFWRAWHLEGKIIVSSMSPSATC